MLKRRQRQRKSLKKKSAISFLPFLISIRPQLVVLFEFVFLGTISIDIYSASIQNCPKFFVTIVKQIYKYELWLKSCLISA